MKPRGQPTVPADHPISGAAISSGPVAVLGMTGSGKSYATRGAVEAYCALHQQARICVFDPTGAWWGICGSADGKAKGLEFVVFGGLHADVPLHPSMGAALGELIGEGAFKCVIDVSDFTSSERTSFAAAFFEAIYHANRKRPILLVVDEVDLVAPQVRFAEGEQGKLLNRVEHIARRGRLRGFRLWMISQRPADVSKKVLSQAGTLVALMLTAPQDRKAIRDYIDINAKDGASAAIMDALPTLARGEGYIWSPRAGLLERVIFPRIRTFDSMRDPEEGETLAEPEHLAKPDLAAIRAMLANAVEEIEASKPDKLKARIAELEREIAALKKAPAGVAPAATQTSAEALAQAEARGYDRGAAASRVDAEKRIAEMLERAAPLAERAREIARTLEAVERAAGTLGDDLAAFAQSDATLPALPPAARPTVPPPPPVSTPARIDENRRAPAPAGEWDNVGRRILGAIADFNAMGIESPTRNHVALFAGYLHARTKSFTNALSALHAKGAVAYLAEGRIRLRVVYPAQGQKPTRSVLIGRFMEALATHADTRRTLPWFRLLGERFPGAATRAELAQMLGYQHLRTKSFANALGSLRSKGLIDYASSEDVVFAEEIRAALLAAPEG